MMDLSSLSPQVLQPILEGPALAPPPGLTPEFDNPPSRNVFAYAIVAVTIPLSSIFFLFRLYSRLFCVKRLKPEDFLVLAAYGLATAHTWVLFMVTRHPGYFVHQWDVRLKDLAPNLYASHIGANLYLGSILAIKAAIILEWFRIFNPMGERNTFFWLGYTILVLNTLFYASALFIVNLTCIPQERIWDKTVPGRCIDVKEYCIATAAFNVLSDIFILILPQRVVWRLQMTTKRKIGISLIFAVGILTCIAAVGRVYTSKNYVTSEDQVYALSPLSLLAHIETHLSLLVICIPSVPSVFRKLKLSSKLKTSKQSIWRTGATSASNFSTHPSEEYHCHAKSSTDGSCMYNEPPRRDISLSTPDFNAIKQ
ncbi:hypothetical protein F4680DRAFT_400001 [Xylaria scruposa]|nr:hypothetical protein F4680DRAFT_400001 [Xylaria scruposa]